MEHWSNKKMQCWNKLAKNLEFVCRWCPLLCKSTCNLFISFTHSKIFKL